MQLEIWYCIAKQADWRSLADVGMDYRSADIVGRVLIFNIMHNRFWLIVRENCYRKMLFVKALLTHKK